ncbi:hypothetical protein QE152_g34344 [Popillia japonica]|uniref:Uncharacterized protein n=1 Tax=Popillia japonica TaxID=7064 RepID=A0AAW1ITT0_POPJA
MGINVLEHLNSPKLHVEAITANKDFPLKPDHNVLSSDLSKNPLDKGFTGHRGFTTWSPRPFKLTQIQSIVYVNWVYSDMEFF